MEIDDELAKFAAQSEEEKQDAFEASTISLVLAALGTEKADIARYKREMGSGYGCDWFNSEGYLDTRLACHREFRFSFEELFTKPAKHPVVLAFREIAPDKTEPVAMIFKVFGLGRMIATNRILQDDTHIHLVLPDRKINITPFAGYFERFRDG